jgi:hypothetical protein
LTIGYYHPAYQDCLESIQKYWNKKANRDNNMMKIFTNIGTRRQTGTIT